MTTDTTTPSRLVNFAANPPRSARTPRRAVTVPGRPLAARRVQQWGTPGDTFPGWYDRALNAENNGGYAATPRSATGEPTGIRRSARRTPIC